MSSLRLNFLSTSGVGASAFCGMFKFVKLRTLAAAAIGGAFGALVRYFLSASWDRKSFPFGTFAANMSASFILGTLTALASRGVLEGNLAVFSEAGFCAALSTFSSLAFQIAEMLSDKRYLTASFYATSTIMLGMALFLSAEQGALRLL